ncbi:GNAT family N-acetyltransferase [Psychroserpens luteolus]|uniref:GNAT family N-acetyltransferase n=1 Tax=Psychroserpens luteolus TaxID=2855840 RepID=UPI001E563670|nr:GNAT family N-acetyltransferase [Psychroserpens luteolus]MCD2259503.1 GNAT family N-acetyltransferase [Psychroserpens luteolus]
MNAINIVNRELTSEEIELVNSGFDDLSIEEGIDIESTEKISFVALKENRLIGCSSGLAHKNGETYSGWFYLTDLFVEKDYRDQGLGSDLLKALEEKTKTIGVQNIWLWTSGVPTLRFYDRHGYKPFTEMENWYSDGSSRIGLRKKIIEL